MRTVVRGGAYHRVADPGWDDPLDGSHAARRGGRWNPPASFPVVYLCRDLATSRANVFRRLDGHPYGPEDLRPGAGPVLVTTEVPRDRYLNAVTGPGCADLGLPRSYPRHANGRIISWARCQPIGARAHEAALPGVAARSAAPTAPAGSEELAYFVRRRALRVRSRAPFERWFWDRGSAPG